MQKNDLKRIQYDYDIACATVTLIEANHARALFIKEELAIALQHKLIDVEEQVSESNKIMVPVIKTNQEQTDPQDKVFFDNIDGIQSTQGQTRASRRAEQGETTQKQGDFCFKKNFTTPNFLDLTDPNLIKIDEVEKNDNVTQMLENLSSAFAD